MATNIWVGDYAAKNAEGALKTFSELAENSSGIERIGVLRADVDNLGSTFVQGFVRKDIKDKFRYLTISRTTTLSRSLSIFFKYHINTLLKKGQYFLRPKTSERNIVIVYAGGDDMFLVGAWDEVLSAAIDIYKAFQEYTGGTLTLPAGFALFPAGYPIARMASETAELEERAKKNQYDSGQKNSISLFGLEVDNGILKDTHTMIG